MTNTSNYKNFVDYENLPNIKTAYELWVEQRQTTIDIFLAKEVEQNE